MYISSLLCSNMQLAEAKQVHSIYFPPKVIKILPMPYTPSISVLNNLLLRHAAMTISTARLFEAVDGVIDFYHLI